MDAKNYYGYVKPIKANHPWSLERIPVGLTVLSNPATVELRKSKSLPLVTKVSDYIGVSSSPDGLILPIGTYLVDLQFTIELPVAGESKLNIGDQEIVTKLDATTPTIIRRMLVYDSDGKSQLAIKNINTEPIKVSSLLVTVTKL